MAFAKIYFLKDLDGPQTTGVTISTRITLSGGPTETWIFQVSGSFNQASNVAITLLGGAVHKNILWVIAGTITIGANATFQGNILAKTNVDVGTHAIDNGCIYAETAVHIQQATISCSVTPPPSSSTTPPPQSSTITATSTSTAPATTFTPPCTSTGTSCFTTAIENLNASIEAGDFLTFILTDTAEANFDNAKNTTMLTCSIYAGCHTAAEAINTGGQTLPDGSLSTVTSSSGVVEANTHHIRETRLPQIGLPPLIAERRHPAIWIAAHHAGELHPAESGAWGYFSAMSPPELQEHEVHRMAEVEAEKRDVVGTDDDAVVIVRVDGEAVVVEMDLEVASQGDEVGGNDEGRGSTPRGWIDSSRPGLRQNEI
ncbi:hypothetical protein B0H14DRAFT_3461577 [Mycena olivaceomarginata]|nr:hypothetical protein B0H14DRAFT_3461577 [Mycena olivaceomarginata]